MKKYFLLSITILLIIVTNLQAQIITTVAGGSVGDGGLATSAVLSPLGVTIDGIGNLYIVDGSNRIRKIDRNGIISTFAGNGSSFYNGSTGTATKMSINPSGIAIDTIGNVYIADSYNNRIRKISKIGILTTIAGDSIQGYSGDGGLAIAASLSHPSGVAVDNIGNVYIADYGNNRIRKVDTNHIISTVAGNGISTYNGDGGKAIIASLNPIGISLDIVGNLYISDYSNNRIRKVDVNGIITTIAGGFGNGFSGDGILATSATLWNPKGITLDTAGNLFIADQNNNRIRKVNTKGIITTIAGGGYNLLGDGGKATSVTLTQPSNVFVDYFGNIYISENNYRLRKVDVKGIITTIAGNGKLNFRGDGGQAIDASMSPMGVTVDKLGNLYISDYGNNRIRKVGLNGIINTIAGDSLQGYSGDGIKATLSSLYTPSKTALDNKGNLYICDENNNRIRKVDTNGIITTFAGNNSQGYSGDGALANQAQINTPFGVATDNMGNIYIAEYGSNVIRKVDTTGIISTIVGNGNRGYSGDGGLAILATLNQPYDVTVDTIGNLYLIDQGNNVIRKVDKYGIISTVAGTGGRGYGGDEDSAINANLNAPRGIAIDRIGNLYISDNGNQRIRMVNPKGIISTIVGNGTFGYNGDGGLASEATLDGTSGISVDFVGNLYIAESGGGRIRKVDNSITHLVPIITTFSPLSGSIGTQVTITGKYFSSNASKNIVYFGAVKANIITATTTSLTVTVPAGATFQPISVTVDSLKAYSSFPFIVTYNSVNSTIDSNSFAPKMDIPTGDFAISVALSDLDGDGLPDVIVSNYNDSTISIYKNTSVSGVISFGNKVTYKTNGNPYNLLAEDINEDGKPDLLIANNLQNSSVSIFINTSTNAVISFNSKVDFPTDQFSKPVVVNDFDGDGRPDLVVANAGSGTISILRNTSLNGILSFAPKVDFATGSTAFSVSVGDLDKDGLPDLIVAKAYNDSSISIFRNVSTIGSIVIQNPIDLKTGNTPYGTAICDLDGDGKLDIVVANVNGSSISILKNNSAVGYISFSPKIDYKTNGSPIFISITDLNGDGKIDIVTANQSSNSVSVFQNNSISGNITFLPRVDFKTGIQPQTVATGDLNGDGRSEIITGNYGTNTISILQNLPFKPTTNKININGCNSLIYNNLVYTASIVLKDTIRSIHGMDSIFNIINIVVNKITPTNQTNTLTGCNSIVYNGITYTNTIILKDTIKNNQGCDSIYNTINIIISKITTSNQVLNLSHCNSITYKGNTYTNSTFVFDTLKTVIGCDSVYLLVVLNVNTITPIIDSINLNSCDSVIYKNVVFKKSRTFIDTIRSVGGCDSIYFTVNIVISLNIYGAVYHPTKGYTIPNVSTVTNGSFASNFSIGSYGIHCLPSASNEIVKLYKNNDVNKANGVTTLDIALVQSHILQKSILNSPLKIIAADVNGDNKVSTLDIVYMKRLILGIDTSFTNSTTKQNRLWAFVDSGYKFIDASSPFPYKDSISFVGLNTNQINQSFIGLKLGDVDWNWNPAVAKPGINNLNAIELYYSSDDKRQSSDEVRIPIRVKNFKDLLGLQYTLHFNAAEMKFVGVNNKALNFETGTNHASEGKVSFLWVDTKNEVKTLEDGTVVFELVFERTGKEAIGKEAIENVLSVDGSVTTVVAYDKDYQSHDVVMKNVPITITDTKDNWVVAPNPTKDGVIQVQMNLRESKTVVFRLLDNTGKLLLAKQVEGVKGINHFTLREGNIASGTYYLQAVGVEGVKQLRIEN